MISSKIIVFLVQQLLFAVFFLQLSWSNTLPFCPENHTNTAVVIIDMQSYFMSRVSERKKTENSEKIATLLSSQMALIQKAKDRNIPIIFIEYEGDFGRTNYRLIDMVKTYNNVRFYKKTSDGMFDSYNFHREKLVRHLQRLGIGHLIVAGINGDACVLASIRGALKNNCSVTLFTPGVANFNFSHLTYPYSARDSLKTFNSKCTNCSFQEFSDLSEVDSFFDRSSFVN